MLRSSVIRVCECGKQIGLKSRRERFPKRRRMQVSPFVNLLGAAVPTVYASHCGPATLPNTWVTCLAGDSVGNNAVPTATLLQFGISAGGDPANRKGRLIFGRGPRTSLNSGHYITLVDSNPTKTLNTRGYRPFNDKTDTYIGLDNGSVPMTHVQHSSSLCS